VAAILVLVVLGVVAIGRSSGSRAPPSTAAPTTAVTVVATTPATVATTALPAGPQVSDIGQSLLPGPTGTELVVHTTDALYRIELDRGRVVRTPVPVIGSGAPTFVVLGSNATLLRPLDFVTGYLVPDDGPARPLTGRLADGTFGACPGPMPDELWLSAGSGGQAPLEVVRLDGSATGVSVPLHDAYPFGCDGAGGVLVTANIGTRTAALASTRGLTPITSGTLLAAGARAWLVRECVPTCSQVRIDRLTGARRTVPGDVAGPQGPARPTGVSVGLVTPDGAEAAVVVGSARLVVVDLASGASQPAGTVTDYPGVIAWSANSRFLFAVDDTGRLTVFDAVAGRPVAFPLTLDHVEALAVRPAP